MHCKDVWTLEWKPAIVFRWRHGYAYVFTGNKKKNMVTVKTNKD